jgi:hypothetical protein
VGCGLLNERTGHARKHKGDGNVVVAEKSFDISAWKADFDKGDDRDRRIVESMGSRVLIDEANGLVYKSYRPGKLIRALYWISFQAKFPYESNIHALRASELRREIADLVLEFELMPGIVSQARSTDGDKGLLTEFVSGTAPRDEKTARGFLKYVTRAFLRSGLPTWQVAPWQPRSPGNLIEGTDWDYRIIDLESNLVSPFVPLSQLGELLDQGLWPAFDDINVSRMRRYLAKNRMRLIERLGADRAARLEQAVDQYAEEAKLWHKSELRLVSRGLQAIYKVVTLPAAAVRGVRKLFQIVRRAEGEVEKELVKGIERWEDEGRLTTEQAVTATAAAQTPEARIAIRHLGAHVAMSVPLRFPLGSIARPAWTFAYRVKAEWAWLRGRREEARQNRAVHTFAVMLLGAIPGAGAFAYAAAAPLRRNITLVQVLSDQLGEKLPFGLHRRLGLKKLATVGRKARPVPSEVESLAA